MVVGGWQEETRMDLTAQVGAGGIWSLLAVQQICDSSNALADYCIVRLWSYSWLHYDHAFTVEVRGKRYSRGLQYLQ